MYGAFPVCRNYTVRALLCQSAHQEQSHNERGTDVAGPFQLFHHSQYLRPHRRGQQDGSREHDCQQNQPWRTSRKKEISQAKNCLREPTSPAEIESVLSAIWGKSGRQNGRQAEILSATQKIPKPLKGLGIRNAGGGGRTHTVSPPTDFESVSSANSNTPACKQRYYYNCIAPCCQAGRRDLSFFKKTDFFEKIC